MSASATTTRTSEQIDQSQQHPFPSPGNDKSNNSSRTCDRKTPWASLITAWAKAPRSASWVFELTVRTKKVETWPSDASVRPRGM